MTRPFILFCTLIAASASFADAKTETSKPQPSLTLPVALEEIPAATRDKMKPIMKDATIRATCPAEEFIAHADMYKWLLDHPDRTAVAWRNLGIDAIQIKPMKDGKFVWKDQGSELVWQSVAQGPNGRVWYAEGKVKPGLLLPSAPVKAVAILNHTEKARETGDMVIKHQVEIFLKTDSKVATLAAKLLGESVSKMAEQGSEQLLMFFSGIAKYAHDKPEKVKDIFTDKPAAKER
jgi:hypothetical protein